MMTVPIVQMKKTKQHELFAQGHHKWQSQGLNQSWLWKPIGREFLTRWDWTPPTTPLSGL